MSIEIKVGDKVRFTEEYKVHTGNFYVGLIDDDKIYPYILVADKCDIGINSEELSDKYTTETRDYDVADFTQIEFGWIE